MGTKSLLQPKEGIVVVLAESVYVADFFLTTEAEKYSLLALLDEAKQCLASKHAPAGYNIGINVGEVAGQTIFHVHLHLIPRYHGDTEHPRGGVRGVIPSRQSY